MSEIFVAHDNVYSFFDNHYSFVYYSRILPYFLIHNHELIIFYFITSHNYDNANLCHLHFPPRWPAFLGGILLIECLKKCVVHFSVYVYSLGLGFHSRFG